MELVKLQGYVRVERSTFRDEHFYSTQNFLYIIEKGVFAYTVKGKTYRAGALDCVLFKKDTIKSVQPFLQNSGNSAFPCH